MAEHFDATVVGGSFAGVCAAAALSRLGLSVALCEPGLADERRLAGELVQAPGARALKQLGLLDVAWSHGAVPVCGFAVLNKSEPMPAILSYGESEGSHSTGIALEHAVLARALLAHVASLPGVTLKRTRVLRASGFSEAVVRLDTDEGVLMSPLVVAADGRSSKLRQAAGISVTVGGSQRMLGVKVTGSSLPHEGYGHVILGEHAPVLAYRIGRDTIRVLFTGLDGQRVYPSDLDALPQSLREGVEHALAAGEVSSTVVSAMTPSRYAAGRLIIVGDAGGCVHPITATGVSFCATDALRLERALLATGCDAFEAAQRYDAERREPMRTRSLLGPLLAETLAVESIGLPCLRRGLFRYWRQDRSGRGASLALLSTHEPKLSVLASEYLKVFAHSARQLVSEGDGVRPRVRQGVQLLRTGKRVAQQLLSSH